ncbi:unnamed protein product [Nippostrongylus brasiliensis]|uniref:Clc-like protein 5 (inferred by orthology to a C. elegans protein) n=1 Tax=Nippostrongylus brasiliensis TaxID=27835 RepID=A0A158QWU9_NIPBR|nr:unnamed protein product [Nippostrongylus brasiliensis]
MLERFSRLEKCQIVSAVLALVADLFLIVGTLTPAWQVAEDTDVNRYVQSGLWLYCPGSAQCWYIFSDNLINYYEKVDVCRFLLIGDCRKKLLRTPYFFGWHQAVLILNVVAIFFITLAAATAAWSYFQTEKRRIAAIAVDALLFAAGLSLSVSLMVFVINAEMLESKYLIGVKNTFEKYYGYSFYLACIALVLIVFSALGAVLITTFTFFVRESAPQSQAYNATPYRPEQVRWVSSALYIKGFQFITSTDFSHGEYVRPALSPTGEFQQTTRHFYSY